MDLVVKNCKVVGLDGLTEAELGVENGKVVKIARVVEERGREPTTLKAGLSSQV
jgi:dihydroorotase-like cyclic amidohydrolase